MTGRKRFRIRWADLLSMLGICAAIVIVLAALFYGYSLG